MQQPGFTPAVDLDGLSPEEAFAILGNEIRLEIIRVLWQAGAAFAFDDGSDAAETMSYSALQRAVDVPDNGKFNYHLSELAPHFVRRTDDGYRLSTAGKQLARTVVAVSGAQRFDLPEELETDCPLCGAPVAATYEDQWLRVTCTACDGLFGDQAPTGTLFLTTYPAAGLTTRPAEEVLTSGLYRCALDITYLMYGICRACAGPVTASVTVCDDHDGDADQPCGTCGTPFPAWADVRCETCGFAKRLPVEMFATGLVLATELEGEGGLAIDAPTVEEAIDLLHRRVETDVSRDPLRVSVDMDLEAGEFAIVVDDAMDVVAFERRSRGELEKARSPNS